ncbi:hypothetical protein AB4Z09_26350 [Rhodococcus sp. TAF43]|jgi:hypothetical protein|uniref:hypothetical protein n=1 Tax=unclassified Rhodococcus (in: high G+C Gram-positive bacteria) TaxID=192944 RepID=UPI0015840C14|nr:hypothetical protein [Rhodococcus sp. W8901]QKT10416.1 hypothetical protein HUN07_06525 [Rhodococcus sp. W8901]
MSYRNSTYNVLEHYSPRADRTLYRVVPTAITREWRLNEDEIRALHGALGEAIERYGL